MNIIDFYQALGNLFYAVANADGKIVLQEKESINELILHDWDAHLGSVESKEILYQTLRNLIAKGVESEAAFNHFKDYFEMNALDFSEETKKTIMRNAETIAMSSAEENKSELILLTHLNRLFWK